MNASAITSPPPDGTDERTLDALTAALADTTRRGLLRLVRHDEHSAGALARAFPHISRPAVSQHLKVLHDAGLVEVRPVGNRRMYRARVEALAPVSGFIDQMWDDRLSRLKRAAEQLETGAHTMTATGTTDDTMSTTIEHVLDIDAAPSAVYALWTTADGLCAWWGVAAAVDPRPGGAIRVDIDGEHVMVGEVVEADPPRRLRFTFGWEGGDPAPGSTEVDVVIDHVDNGSRLTLRHHGLPIEFIESHVRGWTHFVGGQLAEAAP